MAFYEQLANWGVRRLGAARMYKWGLNLSPMYRRTTGKVTHVDPDLRSISARIRLTWRNANYKGVMFGGSMFSAMDPLAMVALIHILGEDYVVWDQSASIQYKRPANQHVHAKFTFEESELAHIRQQVEECGECIHRMAISWTSADGKVVFSVVNKELYIASKAHHRQKRARQKQKSPVA